MTVAQGISKQTIYKEQSALGTAASGSGGQVLRRTQSVLSAPRDTYETNEIVTHQQSTGVGYGLKKPAGRIDGVLSPGTYAAFFQSLLRADFAATAAITSLTLTIAGAGPYTITRSAGDFLTGGIKAGDVLRITAGSYTGTARDINLLVVSLTATVLTVVALNGSALSAQGPIASSTITVTGKKSKVPLTSHTNDYYTIEEWYPDLARSELFTDCKIAKAEVGLPSSGNATVSFDVLALARALTGSQVLTTPTAETTTQVITALNGIVYANGSRVTSVTGASVTIDGTMKHGDATIGTNSALDIDRGRVAVSGQFSAFFDGVTLQTFYDEETTISLVLVSAENDEDDAEFVAFTMGKVKLTGDAPDDGEKQIMRTYSFTAEINGSGGASLAWDQTIITIQDSSL